MDLTPRAHLLESHANGNMPWWKALAELIDNSLDAGARRVSIERCGKKIIVSDDGNGVEDVSAMFRLGEHKKSSSTKLGRYGIGAKDAWLSCSDVMKVVSTKDGVKTTLQVDYHELVRNSWQCQDPTQESTELPNGTSLEFKLRSDKRAPGREAIDMISWVFSPAIKDGLQLLVGEGNSKQRPEVLKPVEMPDLHDVVDSSFDIDGKLVRIRIGILPEGISLARGPFWLVHGHRVICETSLGIKGGVGRMGGTITLGTGWRLSRHKDDLTENKDRLEDAIYTRIEPILEKASAIAETLEIASLRAEIESMLNEALGEVLEKRRGKGGGKSGSVEPKNTGRKRRNASESDPMIAGSVELPASVGKMSKLRGIKFDWCDMEGDTMGKFDPLGGRVSLNTNNPFVSAMRESRNVLAQQVCVCSLLADYASRHSDGQKLFSFQYTDFAQTVGRLVTGVKERGQDAKVAL
jgi:hypothetical protein